MANGWWMMDDGSWMGLAERRFWRFKAAAMRMSQQQQASKRTGLAGFAMSQTRGQRVGLLRMLKK